MHEPVPSAKFMLPIKAIREDDCEYWIERVATGSVEGSR
jgi:hypothetical protein